jgi:hypothetical protein
MDRWLHGVLRQLLETQYLLLQIVTVALHD